MTHPSPPSAAATADAWRLLAWIAGALCALGLLARLSPLSDLEGRLFWQYMTEDGYLMQTVARNMAIGLGMSTGAGTMPTNGVQPLATFLYAGMHALFEGARTPSMALVTIWSALVSAAAAACFYVAVRRALADDRAAQWIAVPVAVLWFIAPHIVRHGMNGLETGLYHLAVLAAVVYYLGIVAGGQPLVWRQRLALGFLLGVAFLARNDAVFFIAALLLTHLWLGGRTEGGGRGHRLADTVVAGLTSIAVAAPWLA